ncbi:MAG: peptide chain release factor 1 [Blastochloris viridis]|uniref:Peptide chain release factor 1 n=1 Tax=Blastochloris viridis TaxID=1079 RepID=A0A6N4RCU6_BLAVI|nr:MAG: peptide chain release factor 1 [Blastochloris viridis]
MDLREQGTKILERFAAVERDLQDPNVVSDIGKMTSLNREYADLKDVVEAFKAYIKMLDQKEEAQQLMADASADKDFKDLAQMDYEEAIERIPVMEDELKIMLLPKDEDDGRNVMLEIRAGTGGDEAGIFAGDLFKMYTALAAVLGWRVEIQDASEAEKGGYREIIARISGQNVFRQLKFEGGVHRVQRVPATETQGRVHTSAATVAVLPEAEEVDVKIEDKDLRIDVFRSSGPGGQSVNTTDSAVRITHIPTGLSVACQDEKSQLKNKDKAMKILRSRLLAAKREEAAAARGAQRSAMVGSGDRSEKIRTYNYPQNRVSDHRIELTLHNLPDIMMGGKNLIELLNALQRADEAERLAALTE